MITTQALADPSQSAVVRVRGGQPVVTDGPYLEAKEFLGGFYLIDCESRERAIELAAMIPDAKVDGMGIEVRPVMFSAGLLDDVRTDAATEDLLRELAPQVLGVLVRRYGQFEECEDAVQEALLAAAVELAGRRRAGQPARLADHRGLPAVHRPGPQRPRPPGPRARRRARPTRAGQTPGTRAARTPTTP